MNKTIHGIVHGKTIELDEEFGIADGQEVEVSVKIVQAKGKWGEAILRSAGHAQHSQPAASARNPGTQKLGDLESRKATFDYPFELSRSSIG